LPPADHGYERPPSATVVKSSQLTPSDEQGFQAMQVTTTKPTRQQQRYAGTIVAAVVFLVPLGALSIWAVTHQKQNAIALKPSDFAAAKTKWDDSGIANYDLDIVISGASQPKNTHIEVRDGRVTECLENGRRPRQQNVWDNWTIDNQFNMIQEDLNKAAIPNGFKVQNNVVITLHGEFDPTYGIPVHYLRKVARGRSPLQCQWRVERFEPLAKKAGPAAAGQP
jgi:hypothetical protein